MPALTIPDLNNGKTDLDHIKDFATSASLTVTDRLGHVKKSLAGLSADAQAAILANINLILDAGNVATTQAGISTAASVLSQAAAVASAVSLAAKDTIAIGRGLVADGATFWVRPNATDGLTRYTNFLRTSSTTQTLVANLLTGSEFDAVIENPTDLSGNLLTIVGAGNKVGLALTADGTLLAKLGISIGTANGLTLTHNADGTNTLSLGTVAGQYTSALGGMLDLNGETLDDLLTVIDAAGKVGFGLRRDGTVYGKIVAQDPPTLAPALAEIAAARGTRTTLETRLAQGLTAYGDPISPHANKWAIRETRMRFRKRALGEAVQWVGALIGDSYTQNPLRYAQPLTKQLQDLYGFAGIGWIGFGWYGTAAGTWTAGAGQPTGLDGTARSDLVVPQIIGTWTCSYNVAANNTPSLSKITSSTAGDYAAFAVPAGHSACRLFYAGDGTGVIAVSWDDGGSYGADVALATVGAANVALTGTPAGAVTCRIKVVSGNVALAGVDLQSAASGVRVHKLGGSGSSAAQWASVTSATWAAQMLALGSHLHQVMHGTNDQSSGPAPATFAANIGTIFTNIHSVLPYSDRLIVMPAENQRTANAVGMPAYAQAVREYALANDCAYLDMQYFFGSAASNAYEYSYANAARQWYAADLIHPDPNTGGRVMVDAELRLLTAQ